MTAKAFTSGLSACQDSLMLNFENMFIPCSSLCLPLRHCLEFHEIHRFAWLLHASIIIARKDPSSINFNLQVILGHIS